MVAIVRLADFTSFSVTEGPLATAEFTSVDVIFVDMFDQ
jgi:hypothetical protein